MPGGEETGDAYATSSGIPLKPFYRAADATARTERPGEYPYTRGLYPDMYRTRVWTMRQYAGVADPGETNARFRRLLGDGQTGLSIAFDLPTQIGLDPDDPRAVPDVGIVGVSSPTRRDMMAMFEGIPLDEVTTSMTINATAAVLLAQYLATADDQDIPWSKVGGTLQNDVLKEFVARGTYNLPVAPAMRLAVDVMEFCAKEVPRFNAISVSGYHMREAGCTAIEEVAFALSNARAYLDRCVARGIAVDAVAPRVSWIFNTTSDLLEEVAKYRALRRLWATMLKQEYGAKDPKSWMLRTHTQTGGSTLTKQQPENNIARAAIQALAAALGGVQSMALSCYDEALAIPTEKAQRIALRTQQIVANESGVTKVADPLAGSYLIEHLTETIAKQARTEMDHIATLGGAERAVETEFYHRRIAEGAYRFDEDLRSGRRIIVGVNAYTEGNADDPPTVFRADAEAAAKAKVRLDRVRKERDASAVRGALREVEGAARGDDNMVPAIVAAVARDATVGEITATLERVFGAAGASRVV